MCGRPRCLYSLNNRRRMKLKDLLSILQLKLLRPFKVTLRHEVKLGVRCLRLVILCRFVSIFLVAPSLGFHRAFVVLCHNFCFSFVFFFFGKVCWVLVFSLFRLSFALLCTWFSHLISGSFLVAFFPSSCCWEFSFLTIFYFVFSVLKCFVSLWFAGSEPSAVCGYFILNFQGCVFCYSFKRLCLRPYAPLWRQGTGKG